MDNSFAQSLMCYKSVFRRYLSYMAPIYAQWWKSKKWATHQTVKGQVWWAYRAATRVKRRVLVDRIMLDPNWKYPFHSSFKSFPEEFRLANEQ